MDNIVKIGEFTYDNRTPHEINLVLEGNVFVIGKSVHPPIRVDEERIPISEKDGVKINSKLFTNVQNLPEPKENNYYIVSAMVQNKIKGRADLITPDEIIRNEAGVIIGCRSFYKVL